MKTRTAEEVMTRARNAKRGALTYRRGTPGALIVLALLATAPASPGQQNGRAPWPRRVLVTNDNGIEDRATRALARALARVADTYLVASADDRSGFSNLLTVTRTGEFRVERREVGGGVHAWAIHGTPADAVVFALTGPMRDSLPDLIVSGINGGSNVADDWLGSGTIGAVRTGSYFGVPGIAVSGVDDDDSTAVRVVVDWVVRLVQSPMVRALRAPQYLTVSLPELAPSRIGDPVVVRRARGIVSAVAKRQASGGAEQGEVWKVTLETHPERAGPDTDVAAVAAGRIAIVPMRVDEYDDMLARKICDGSAAPLPRWSASEGDSKEGGVKCTP
jgi:5'-nucleotidase